MWGPSGSFIEGNNEVALALIMAIPLMRYLQLISGRRWVRLALGVAMALTALAALGSQSRGALLAIMAMAALLWVRSDHKAVSGIVIVALAASLVAFMPGTWDARMQTIDANNLDSSAEGRINAWKMAWNLAKDRPIGGGFEVITPELFARYAPNPNDIHAAHSIYFQVLGEHGFPGLFLFVLLWWLVWRHAGRMRRLGAHRSDAEWARHLGGMIQVSLIGYLVGGAFLSLAYFDLPYDLLVLVVVAQMALAEKPLAGKVPGTASEPARRFLAHRAIRRGSEVRVIWRSAFALASPGGTRARLSILIFHRVLPQQDPLFPGEIFAEQFAALMSHVASRFRVLALHDAVQALAHGTLPARAMAITFDDGYADNLEIAAPILQHAGLPATVFVATGYLDGSCMWNDLVIQALRATQRTSIDLQSIGLGTLVNSARTRTGERRSTRS